MSENQAQETRTQITASTEVKKAGYPRKPVPKIPDEIQDVIELGDSTEHHSSGGQGL